MAEKIIVWTDTAIKQRREILKYWTIRNKSTSYAEKLIKLTKNHLQIIQKSPKAFKETDVKKVRESAMGHFSVFYKVTRDRIIIVAFWDNRQNPNKLFEIITKSSKD